MIVDGANLTDGNWQTEAESFEAFDDAIERSQCFYSLKEVWGDLTSKRPAVDAERVRIDRVLIPKKKLLDAGWPHGPIGIEGKKSGHKLGKMISQALSYTRAQWEIGEGFCLGWSISLKWLFLWPVENVGGGDVESICANNRIGAVSIDRSGAIRFRCGAYCGIKIDRDGNVFAKRLPMGNKEGSR